MTNLVPYMVDVQFIQTKLLELTELRKQVVASNDAINRVFSPLLNKDSTPPTFDDLQRDKEYIENFVTPFFYVDFVAIENVYCLVTQPKRS